MTWNQIKPFVYIGIVVCSQLNHGIDKGMDWLAWTHLTLGCVVGGLVTLRAYFDTGATPTVSPTVQPPVKPV